MTQKPLTGVRALDLTRLLPGPYGTCVLADFGAEVIRVERPGGGDWMREISPRAGEMSVLFQMVNRNKKSVTVNLKSVEGRAVFLRLVDTADVLVEGFRPGVMARLGLGYETLARANPGLVYCSLSGYGLAGPYRDRVGHDLNYVGLAGLLSLTGSRDGPPVVPGTLVADLAGALWAVIGILLALRAREQTGRGQRLDSSLFGGALSFLPFATSRSLGGEPMARGASDMTGGQVCYQVYETGDGEYMTVSALEPAFWQAFCQAVGREDWVEQQFAATVPGEPVYDGLCALFRTRTRQEWVELLAGVDACCEPVYTVDEALASPIVQALEMLGDGGILPPVRVAPQREFSSSPAPSLGEHTETLLAELGYGADEIKVLRAQGAV